MVENEEIKRGTMVKLFLVISLVLVLTQLISAINEFDQYKPYLHNPSTGHAPKLETFGEYKTELFPGAGTYTYRIDVSPGVRGLQPILSINYNSQSATQRPGILGAGWSLTENSVIRHINFTANNTNDDYFILTINNARYRVLYNGSTFNTELNPNQFRIENLSNSGKMYWVVTITDGTKYRFGFNNDSLLGSNTGKSYDIKWSLDQIQDVHNNKISYTYREDPFSGDNGTVYLANITYNNDNLKLITFEYENATRPDRRFVYEQGNKLDESRRLQNISVYFNNSLVRKYILNYTDLNSEKSLTSLSNITYIGSDNSSVLNTIGFQYFSTQQGFDNSTGKWVVPSQFVFSSTTATRLDFGVREVDVNNDGFPDLVKAKAGETHETRLNNKSSGWNTGSTLTVPAGIDIVDSNSVDQGVRFADANGDGLVDILKAKGGSSRQVYINNGTAWNLDSSWSIPLDFVNSSSFDQGVVLVDFNGDGKTDILQAKEPSTKNVYINNGTGWVSGSSWNIPDYFVTSDSNDTGLRIIDLNNDGLSDFIKGGIPGSAWLNNGTSWENYSQYAPNISFVDHNTSRPDLGVRFMEINGDGLTDILQNFLSNVSIPNLNQTCMDNNGTVENCTYYTYNITNGTDVKINNGSGWVLSSGWFSPERFTSEGYNIGRRIADVNGDGYSDIVVAYENASFQSVTHIKNGTSAFLLKRVVNAYGGITDISYNQSTLSNNSNSLGFNIWVVGNTTLNNSLSGAFGSGSNYLYRYNSGKFDYSRLEFMGFGAVNETLPDNSTIAHSFHQDATLRGREFMTNVYSNNGTLHRSIVNTFTNSSGMIFLNQTSLQVYDGATTPFTSNTSFEYDSYGNVKRINSLGDTGSSGDEKYEVFNYEYNLTNFVVNKPINYTLFASDNSTIVRQTLYSYDNLSSGVGIGDLTKIKRSNNGSDPEIQYVYDSFGNIIREIESLGSHTNFTYESTGVFRTRQTNYLGHQTNYSYNLSTGNLLLEVRDDLNKSFEYDTFGRIKKEIVAPDTSSLPTKNYTYTFDGIASENIKIQTKKNGSAYSEDIFLYDGFGNLVQTKSLFDDGRQIVKNYFYDGKYRISKEQNPYFDTYSENLNTNLTGSNITYVYDALDRVLNLTKQDGSLVRVIFDRATVSQYDENNNRIDYVLDAYNRIKNVLEYNTNSSGGQETYTTTYTYDATDSLTQITDNSNNNFIFEYDKLGRRTRMDDPNMNEWRYGYDLNGNLINQTDGRNVTTNLTYDNLNRIKTKYSGSKFINFSYDGQFKGTLSNITFNGSYFNQSTLKYVYGDRLRVTGEQLLFNSQWINSSVDYDSADRIINQYLPNTNLTYNYSNIGKIISIRNFISNVNLNAFGSVINKTYNNSLVSDFTYDSLNRITRIKTSTLQDLNYAYDSFGNIRSINDAANSKNYTMGYDSLNRLINTTINNSVFFYKYSPIANVLSYNTSTKNVSFGYNSSLAHAPTNVSGLYTSNLTVTLLHPANGSTVNYEDLHFDFNTTEDSLCYMHLNYTNTSGNFNTQTNFSASVRKNQNFSFTSNHLWEDNITYTWNITCYDYFGQSTSQSRQVKVNTAFIGVCRELTQANRYYRIINDLEINGSDCIRILADNITVDGQGHIIAGNRTLNTEGINSILNKDITIKNVTIGNFDDGILYSSNDGNLLYLFDITSTENEGNGISISGSIFGENPHWFNNINTSRNKERGIIISTTNKINLTNINSSNNLGAFTSGDGIRIIAVNNNEDFNLENITTNNNNGDGIYLDCNGAESISINNLVSLGNSGFDSIEIAECSNSTITNGNLTNVRLISSSTNITFLNVTYNTETVPSGSQLTRKWYFETQVNDSSGYLENATVTIANVSNISVISENTTTNGDIGKEELIEYVNSSGTTTYHTPHTVNTSKSGYVTNTTIYNLSLSHNIFHPVILSATTILDLHSLTQLYSTASTERTFGFFITNLNSSTMNNVTWKFNTGTQNITSQYASNLSAGDSKYVVFEYNYSSPGTYNVVATAFGGDGSISDSETLQVIV